MNKTNWEPGLPSVPGFYWFYIDLKAKIDLKPLVLQLARGSTYAFGPYGGGPVDMMFGKTGEKHGYYASIVQPKKWVSLSEIENQDTYGWVKDPEGHIGFAILSPGSHDDTRGDWYWLDKPGIASEHLQYVDNDKGYLFCPVKVPDWGK